MKSLIRFVVTLVMPLVLIVGGGTVAGWGITNDWEIVGWIGLCMVGAGILWGLALWLWINEGGLF